MLAYNTVIDWTFKPTSVAKAAFIIILLFYLLVSPVLYLAFNNYQAVFSDKIIANSGFSFKKYVYEFQDIVKVTVTSEYFTRNDLDLTAVRPSEYIAADLLFYFKDGRVVDFWGEPSNKNDSQLISNLYAKLKETNISIEIPTPPQNVLNNIARWCPDEQRQFNAMFELNLLIMPNSSSDCRNKT